MTNMLRSVSLVVASATAAAGGVGVSHADNARQQIRPTGAKIHLVLNDHGRLHPEIAALMLTSYRGGCSDGSLPPPFPASAKADGVPGPNACVLIQDAIFQQDRAKTNRANR